MSVGLFGFLAVIGTNLVAAGVISGIIGAMALPVLMFIREVAVFSPTRILEPKEAEVIAGWFIEAGRSLGIANLNILYIYRKGAGLQVVQLSGSPPPSKNDRGMFQSVLAVLVHRAAWNAMPAIMNTSGSIYVVIPARVMEKLYLLSGRSAWGSYLQLTEEDDLKLIYKILHELALTALGTGNKVYAAYLATKAFTKMLIKGFIRVSPELASIIDKIIPLEPPWIRRKVVEQIRLEAMAALEP